MTPPSEHYPVRQVIDVGGVSDGYPTTVTATREHVFCGCTDSLEHDYGHEQEAS